MTKLLQSNVRVVQTEWLQRALSRMIQEEHARFGAVQTQASWEPGKHNARHGFLNRSRSIWTIIYLLRLRVFARARARFTYVCDLYGCAFGRYVRMYTYVCVLCMLFLSSTPHCLPPRSTGQWLAASNAPLQSTPVLYSASYNLPFPSSLARPSSPLISTRCPSLRLLLYVLYNASPSLDSFVLSFVRSCYSCREQPGVSETSMRDSSSFLVSSLHPYPFPFALPFPPPPAPGYPRTPLFSAAPSLPLSNPARFHG